MSFLLRRFLETVKQQADLPAVISGDAHLSYQQLYTQALRIASYLKNCSEDRPYVLLQAIRSERFLAAMLGILLSGKAFVPVDTEWPVARLEKMIDSAHIDVAIGNEDFLSRLSTSNNLPFRGIDTLACNEDHVKMPDGEDASAYLIFTSGTTGEAKGVVVEHRNVDSYITGMVNVLKIVPGRSFASVGTLAADLTYTNVFLALATGGTLHFPDDDLLLDGHGFSSYMHEQKIDYCKMTPSHMSALLSSARHFCFPQKGLILGGEELSWQLVNQIWALSPEVVLINHYGPTEVTIGSTVCLVNTLPRKEAGMVPIGLPLPHVTPGWKAFDENRQELILRGHGVARGYIQGNTFLPFPTDHQGERFYETGDLVTTTSDGLLHYAGRKDEQVKIRGFKVEPQAIDSLLFKRFNISWTKTIARGKTSEDRKLYTFLLKEQVNEDEIQSYLASQLPSYMQTELKLIETIPLAANRKLDTAQLLNQSAYGEDKPILSASAGGGEEFDHTHRAIHDKICELLNRSTIEDDTNFLLSGGNSLLAIRFINWLRQEYDIQISAREFFAAPTLQTIMAKWRAN